MRTAGDDPGAPARMADTRTVARNVAGRGLEAGEGSARPALLHFRERVAANEVTLAELHGPAKARFVWIDGFVHVVSVETQSGFETSRISRAEARRKHAFRFPVGQDGVPCVSHPW